MANIFKLKRSAVAGKVPATTDLQLSELAVNTFDGRVYTKKDNGTVSIVDVGDAPTGSGPPTSTPPNGRFYLDLTNERLYVRVNGAWKYTQLGGLTWQSGT